MTRKGALAAKIDLRSSQEGSLHPEDSRISAVWVEPEGDGYLLYRLNDQGNVMGDTWHESFEGIGQQIISEFGVSGLDWIEVVGDPLAYCSIKFR